MTYTRLNALLVEYFGELEQLCNQIYQQSHGVTVYIEEMMELKDRGAQVVRYWDYYLKRLKEVRHKRNKLSHGEVSFGEAWAEKEDLDFLSEFKEKLLDQTDPIALYRKHLKARTRKNARANAKRKKKRRNTSGCLAGIIAGVLVAAAAVWVYYYFIA
ncbi:MAG: hypothetical protein IKM48_08485 [Clostridia bacterium]|nr:hypothetical protein [Clostridia bacterium]